MMRVFFGKPRRVLKGWEQPGSKAGADMGAAVCTNERKFLGFHSFQGRATRHTSGAYTPPLHLTAFFRQIDLKKKSVISVISRSGPYGSRHGGLTLFHGERAFFKKCSMSARSHGVSVSSI